MSLLNNTYSAAQAGLALNTMSPHLYENTMFIPANADAIWQCLTLPKHITAWDKSIEGLVCTVMPDSSETFIPHKSCFQRVIQLKSGGVLTQSITDWQPGIALGYTVKHRQYTEELNIFFHIESIYLRASAKGTSLQWNTYLEVEQSRAAEQWLCQLKQESKQRLMALGHYSQSL